MAALDVDRQYTRLSDREIASSGIGSSPTAISAFRDLQRAAFENNPGDTAEVSAAAEAAAQAAAAADASALAAQTAANQGLSDAATAQARADDAYTLAETKVTKDAGPLFAAPTATPSRAALPSYTGGTAAVAYDATEITALKAQVATLTGLLAGVITDLRANGALTDA